MTRTDPGVRSFPGGLRENTEFSRHPRTLSMDFRMLGTSREKLRVLLRHKTMHIGFVPSKAPFRIGTAAILLAGTLCGTSFYASPTGSATGDGSFNAPWDLQTALNSTGAIQPG